MRLTMMRDFLESENHQRFINNILENWGYDQTSVHFFRASSNFIYIFKRNDQKLVLRVTPNGNIKKLQAELSFLAFLHHNHYPVNLPIESKQGNQIEILNGALGTFHAVVFHYLEGHQMEFEEFSHKSFHLWGESLGKLHSLSQRFSASRDIANFPSFEKQIMHIEPVFLKNELAMKQEYEIIKTWLLGLKKAEENYGLLHFDFELDNIIWSDNIAQVIDFESSMMGWYAADIAFALRDAFANGGSLDHESVQNFIRGYRQSQSISEDEITTIPLFLRAHRLLTYAQLLESMDLISTENQPDWIIHLYNKLKTKTIEYQKAIYTQQELI